MSVLFCSGDEDDYQECSYACDPVVNTRYSQFYPPTSPGPPAIPLCASYCDAWFSACQNDYTCVENWQTWPLDADGKYTCPAGSPCRTYAQVYGNGAGLCSKMWGNVYNYSTSASQWWVLQLLLPGKVAKLAHFLPLCLALPSHNPRLKVFLHPPPPRVQHVLVDLSESFSDALPEPARSGGKSLL